MNTNDYPWPSDLSSRLHFLRTLTLWLSLTAGPALVCGHGGDPSALVVPGEPSASDGSIQLSDSASPAAEINLERNVVYSQPAGKRLTADIYRPATSVDLRPAVLMIHGGGWRYGTKAQMVIQSRRLAERGYVAMSINYRLAPKYKHPAQVHDCKAAVRWLRQHADEYDIDPTRIGVYGYSAGGHLACMLGVTDAKAGLEGPGASAIPSGGTRVQAVVAGGAPCDFRSMPADGEILSYWLGGSRQALPNKYEEASPITAVSPDDPPTFFFHGERDWIVPPFIARRMRDALRGVGVETDFFVCQGDGHINAFTNQAAREAAEAFLDKVLQP